MISAIRPEADSVLFTLAMASIGGIGLAISQIGNVNLSSADQSRSTEIGGMGTAQNLGASLGRGHRWHGPVHCPRQPTHHNGEQQPLDQPCAEAGHRSGARRAFKW